MNFQKSHCKFYLKLNILSFSHSLSLLGSGSDQAAFIIVAGIPGRYVRYFYNLSWPLATYPLYHSACETFHAVDNYIDRGFKVSKT